MREIKFRVWSKERREMIYADAFGWYRLAFVGSNGYWQDTRLDTAIKHEKTIAMQYTGLKDMNGKEIFEGDIVNVYPGEGAFRYEEVRFYTTDGQIGLHPFTHNPDSWSSEKSEVVGNICENPELLEDK